MFCCKSSQPACVVHASCHYVILPGFAWCVFQLNIRWSLQNIFIYINVLFFSYSFVSLFWIISWCNHITTHINLLLLRIQKSHEKIAKPKHNVTFLSFHLLNTNVLIQNHFIVFLEAAFGVVNWWFL